MPNNQRRLPLAKPLFQRPSSQDPRRAIGDSGEAKAAAYLKTSVGLKIVETNWECSLGEIDIIARDSHDTIVIVEVKTVTSDEDFGWEAIGPKKRQRLVRLAHCYLKANKLPLETSVRFDAVIVNATTQEVTHEESAFWADDGL
mgnify:CR=1 FL=1